MLARILLTLPLVACALGVGCGDAGPGDEARLDVEERRPDAPPLPPASECVVTTWREAAGPRDHRDPCSAIDHPSEPPASGPHYSVWADFQTYAEPVPWGFAVHALEHGAVFLGYDCPEGCPEVLAGFERIIAAQGADPLCEVHPTADARFIVAPVEGLQGSVVALAWEHAYEATCFDEASLADFVEAHYGQAPEALCNAGLAADGTWCEG